MKRMFRRDLPSVDELKRLFNYDPVTGQFTWRVKPCRHILIGSVAGTKTRLGYYDVRIERVPYMVHRLIWKIVTGQKPPDFIDHADRDGTNNAWSNLREATCSQNGFNRKLQKNKSGAKGVRWNTSSRKWEAIIQANYKKHYVGVFDTIAQAATAADHARLNLHGEFARVG